MSSPVVEELSFSPFVRSLPACRAVRVPPHRLVALARGAPQRRHFEDFVRREFAAHFGAHVKHFMPVLLGLLDAAGDPRAVVGCRSAENERLFLETYTRVPIEHALERQLGVAVARQEIVEVGGLACRDARAAVDIVGALIPHLLEAGFSWVVFTGADTVKNVFRRLGLMPTVLCSADPALLGPDRDDWGSYYDHHPEVMTGRLRDGQLALRAAAAMQ
jgi:thermostable hemolysin